VPIRNLALLGAIFAASEIACCASAIACCGGLAYAQSQLSGQYDGVYTGTGESDPLNPRPLCGPPVPQRLTITNGVASLGANDPRTGTVTADGHLHMAGMFGQRPANIDGQLAPTGFSGVSTYGDPVSCKYHWLLQKQ
jgi:hypothetical protein